MTDSRTARTKGPLPILCYHRVGETGLEGTKHNNPPAQLRKHVDFFSRRGYEFVRVIDYTLPARGKQVCFTFDDGWKSAVDNGLPLLYDRRLKCTIYLPTDFVGNPNGLSENDRGEIGDWNDFKTAMDHGVEVGNHTARHVPLTMLSREDALAQVIAAKDSLTQRGFGPHSFCYPGGLVPDFGPSILKAAGYSLAVSLLPGPASALSDPLCLPRLHMASNDSLPRLIYRLFLRRYPSPTKPTS